MFPPVTNSVVDHYDGYRIRVKSGLIITHNTSQAHQFNAPYFTLKQYIVTGT